MNVCSTFLLSCLCGVPGAAARPRKAFARDGSDPGCQTEALEGGVHILAQAVLRLGTSAIVLEGGEIPPNSGLLRSLYI
jgi:hypothetical protein